MASISALAIANARIPTSSERRRIRDVRAADLQEEMAEQRFSVRQLRRRRRQPSEHRSERSEQSDTASNQTQRDARAAENARVGCAAVELDWVLFDADGVIQAPRDGWAEDLTAWSGSRAEEFLLAVAAADVSCLTGADFGAAMREVLRQFEISAPLEDVIDREFWIEIRPPMLEAVRAVRDLGLHCGLATNQQNLRGAYMRRSLGFETIFDQQFYSFELGFAKPDTGYFQTIMDRISVAPDRVLFIDDYEDNVAGALEIGINAELFPRDGGVAALEPILARYGVQL